MTPLPTVTIVFLVYNRCNELRTSLNEMLTASDYPSDRVDVIVVDNASSDGSSEMVTSEFPHVRLIRRETNVGISGWNDGFAVARGDFVLALDDDCFLPSDGLRSAVAGAQEHGADLVSFAVQSSHDPEHRFSDAYPTGLLSFWGCAVLMRRKVVHELTGYDPEIFVWANELEFMIRFFDHGFRHLHLPTVVAVHMKEPLGPWKLHLRSYRVNARHFAYIAGKLMRPGDVAVVFVSVLAHCVRDALRHHHTALLGMPDAVRGLIHGLRLRAPVRNREVSRMYRENFHSFAGPQHFARPLQAWPDAVRRAVAMLMRRDPPVPRHPGRRDQFFSTRGRYYPDGPATLDV
jgi:GT2 family glycosyltransferase